MLFFWEEIWQHAFQGKFWSSEIDSDADTMFLKLNFFYVPIFTRNIFRSPSEGHANLFSDCVFSAVDFKSLSTSLR